MFFNVEKCILSFGILGSAKFLKIRRGSEKSLKWPAKFSKIFKMARKFFQILGGGVPAYESDDNDEC